MTADNTQTTPSDSDLEWAGMIKALRKRLNVSQDQLAAMLETNQCTISRWERGITSPNYRMRKLLAKLHQQAPVQLRHDLELVAKVAQELFNCSQVPSLLLHRDGTVVAVSAGNRYRPGMKYTPGIKLLDQTLPQDLDGVHEFLRFLEQNDFWNTQNASFEYRHEVDGEQRCYAVTSMMIDSQVFCLLQKR